MHSVYFFISPFYLFYFTFLINEIPNFFPTMDCTIFQQCKQYVGTGKKTLMSTSDGLGPSVFCRKMERARPMRKEMEGIVVYFPQESAFWLLCINL